MLVLELHRYGCHLQYVLTVQYMGYVHCDLHIENCTSFTVSWIPLALFQSPP